MIAHGVLIRGEEMKSEPGAAAIKDFEILDFEEECRETGFSLPLFGGCVRVPAADFVKLDIRYSGSKVMFSELCGVSWFETEEKA